MSDNVSEIYEKLIKDSDCTPEEQAGPSATGCPKCGRKTVHQWAKLCMSCGWDPLKRA